MKQDVIFSVDNDGLTAYIQCDVDHHTVRGMREAIDRRMAELRPMRLIIDFSRVEFMDSSGLGLILGRVDRASTLGSEVLVTGLSPRLMKLVRLAGIERVRHLSVVK